MASYFPVDHYPNARRITLWRQRAGRMAEARRQRRVASASVTAAGAWAWRGYVN